MQEHKDERRGIPYRVKKQGHPRDVPVPYAHVLRVPVNEEIQAEEEHHKDDKEVAGKFHVCVLSALFSFYWFRDRISPE